MKRLLTFIMIACFIVCCGFAKPNVSTIYSSSKIEIAEIVVPTETYRASSCRIENGMLYIDETVEWNNIIYNANPDVKPGDNIALVFHNNYGETLVVEVTIEDMFSPENPDKDMIISYDAKYAENLCSLLWYADKNCPIDDFYKLDFAVEKLK